VTYCREDRAILRSNAELEPIREGACQPWELAPPPLESARAAAGERSRHQPACCSLDAGKCSTWRPRAECGEEEMDNVERKVHLFLEDFTHWDDVVSIDEF
jgi:hypothetical protein